ncbi:DUF6153 family protein [Nocardia sp. NPDC004654]|uniref:DUF6153 family protein n=1 Tax=Nocardia sp. NPDC004654 TaxID=3154776 RepID=UPI0033ADF5C1
MTAPHAAKQASGFTRLLGVVALIAGIAAMHVGIFTTPAAAMHHSTSAAAGSPAVASAAAVASTPARHAASGSAHHGAATSTAPIAPPPAARISDSDHRSGSADQAHAVARSESSAGAAAQPGCAECGDGHAGLHACVFILTALALAVLLVLLYRIAGDHLVGGPKPRHRRPRRERPPPWTVLSLAELSILRI